MPRTIPKVCPIRVLVLLGSVRPCSLLPVRTLPFKKKKKKKKERRALEVHALRGLAGHFGGALRQVDPFFFFFFFLGFKGQGPHR